MPVISAIVLVITVSAIVFVIVPVISFMIYGKGKKNICKVVLIFKILPHFRHLVYNRKQQATKKNIGTSLYRTDCTSFQTFNAVVTAL